jgi:hypothetical protein
MLERHEGAFYSPQGNLAVGGQKLGHVRVVGWTCPTNLFETRLLSRIRLRGQTCLPRVSGIWLGAEYVWPDRSFWW